MENTERYIVPHKRCPSPLDNTKYQQSENMKYSIQKDLKPLDDEKERLLAEGLRTGIVDIYFVEKGYGFIKPTDGRDPRDCFVSKFDIVMTGCKSLAVDQEVEFQYVSPTKAINVKALGGGEPIRAQTPTSIVVCNCVCKNSDKYVNPQYSNWREPEPLDEEKERMLAEGRRTGVVARYNIEKGFGFIKPTDGRDSRECFVGKYDIAKTGCRFLAVGQAVEFRYVSFKRAIDVKSIGSSEPFRTHIPSSKPLNEEKERMLAEGIRTGVVARFSIEKGYGFIKPTDGRDTRDCFVSKLDIAYEGCRFLAINQEVEFRYVSPTRAKDVKVLGDDMPVRNVEIQMYTKGYNSRYSTRKEANPLDEEKEEMLAEDRRTGVVARYNIEKGFGFIKPTDGRDSRDCFFGKIDIAIADHRSVSVGQEVEFQYISPKRATDVKVFVGSEPTEAQ